MGWENAQESPIHPFGQWWKKPLAISTKQTHFTQVLISDSQVLLISGESFGQSPWGRRISTAELLNFWSCHLMSRPLGFPGCRVPWVPPCGALWYPAPSAGRKMGKISIVKEFQSTLIGLVMFYQILLKVLDDVWFFWMTLNSLRRTLVWNVPRRLPPAWQF